MKITRRQLRRIIREDTSLYNSMLQEGMFQDAVDWIKKKGKDAAASAKEFLEQLKQEMGETKEGAAILTKMVSGKELTPEEATALSTQAKDLAKGLPLLAIVAAPGGGIAAPVLVKLAKKFGIDLMPTAFQESVMKITKRQLRRIIRESYYDSDYAEEYTQSEPPMGSFPHHWDQRQMDDWNQGHQDALDNKGYGSSTSDEYIDGYEAGLQELETRPVGGRGMRQR